MPIIDLTEEQMHFVAACTHVDDTTPDFAAVWRARAAWLRPALARGLRVKVAVDDAGAPQGFVHCLPIGMGAWGLTGVDLLTIPCLTLPYDRVYAQAQGSGWGRQLLAAAEDDARSRGLRGVAAVAFDHDFWFMPLAFFRRLGYVEVERDGRRVAVLKAFGPVAPPRLRRRSYAFEPAPGQVAVDAFHHPMCLTCIGELRNVRQACAAFGGRVALREYDCSDPETLDRCGTIRDLFVDGRPVGWGYEAPVDELRREIDAALAQGGAGIR